MPNDLKVTPNVAVFLATFNGSPHLHELICSILNQKDVNLVLYIRDDLSIDNTLDIARSFNDPRIVLLGSSTRSGSAANNFYNIFYNVNINNHDFIALSDQDDIWVDNKLCTAIQKLISNDCDGYTSNMLAIWPNGSSKTIKKNHPQKKWDHLFSSGGAGCTCVITKQLAIKFTKKLIENRSIANHVKSSHDWLIYAFARSHGYNWFIDSFVSIHYRQHASNTFGVNSGFKAFLNRINLISNGWYRKQVLLVSEFCGTENLLPIKLMSRYRFSDRIILIFISFFLRRKLSEVFLFSCSLLIPSRND